MARINTELEKRLAEVDSLLRETEKRLKGYKNLEEGTLRVTESHGCPQYHFRKKGSNKEQYIPTYEKDKIALLAQRDYDEKIYKLLQDMQKRLEKFIRGFDDGAIEHVYDRMCSGRKKFVNPIVPTTQMRIEKWLEEHKGGVNTYGEATEFKTLRGEFVRSKSEKILADYFFTNQIPYQYEPRFELDDYRNKYPDFVLYNVRNEKTIYWEHLGKVDDPAYVIRNMSKIMDYEKSGLLLGDNLIITLETRERPLNTELVENTVRKFLM